MNFYVITAFYLVGGGLLVGIFIWGKADGNSMFDKLYQVVCVKGPKWLKWALEKMCGKRAPAALDATWTYLCYKTNPLVQIFYLAVLVGGYLTFVNNGYPHLPNRLAGHFHKYTGFAVFVACVSVWWKACQTDPGIVTAKNVDGLCQLFPWDEALFTNTLCSTCNIPKPARSKHCSLCNVCVMRFDHHCIWLNSCVGLGNHKWFLAFLFWHLTICLYACGLGTTIAYEVVVQKDLFRAVFVDPVTREKHTASYMIIGQYMLATEGLLIFVIALAGIMGTVLFGFFLWHLNLVRMGMTTNELSKWNYVKWCLKQDGEEGRERLKSLKFSYNLGCLGNFRQVFFPVDVHRLPTQLARERKDVQEQDAGKSDKPAPAPAGGKRGGKRTKVKVG